MGTKHEILTESELADYNINRKVMTQIKKILGDNPQLQPGDVNILDWGCGRGRSVVKLREMGFNAFGVEVDEETMKKGFPILSRMGLSGSDILRHINTVASFPSDFFHLIFTDQVFEHVADLNATLREMSRLTRTGGVGIHCFPGSANIWEGHVRMPFIHWLPKNASRKYWIAAMLLMGFGPKKGWPHTEGKSIRERVTIFYEYMNEKTYYRDALSICELLARYGYDASSYAKSSEFFVIRLFPERLWRNGFPKGSVTLTSVNLNSGMGAGQGV